MISFDNIRKFDFEAFERHCLQVPYYIMPTTLYSAEMLYDHFDPEHPDESF